MKLREAQCRSIDHVMAWKFTSSALVRDESWHEIRLNPFQYLFILRFSLQSFQYFEEVHQLPGTNHN